MGSGESYAQSQMKRTVVGVVLATALLCGAWRISTSGQAEEARGMLGSGATQSSGVLHVDVSGVRSDSGFIIASLCRKGEVFVSGCSLQSRAKSVKGVVSLEFKGLASGDYALALFHDENNNSALELGSEGIGFSNNVNLDQVAPDFEASRIKVDGLTAIRVRVRYPK